MMRNDKVYEARMKLIASTLNGLAIILIAAAALRVYMEGEAGLFLAVFLVSAAAMHGLSHYVLGLLKRPDEELQQPR